MPALLERIIFRDAALTADLLDPTTTSSGALGGEVLALRMNVDFSAAGVLGGNANVQFGSLTLCAMFDPSLNGLTVSDVLTIASTLLAGGTNGYSISAITSLLMELNGAFNGGTPTSWAQAHLVNGPCP